MKTDDILAARTIYKFEKFTSVYYTKLHSQSCLYLLIIYMKNSTDIDSPRQTKFWQRTRAFCNLHSCYNFVLVLHESALLYYRNNSDNRS